MDPYPLVLVKAKSVLLYYTRQDYSQDRRQVYFVVYARLDMQGIYEKTISESRVIPSKLGVGTASVPEIPGLLKLLEIIFLTSEESLFLTATSFPFSPTTKYF